MKNKKPAHIKNRKKEKNVDYISLIIFAAVLLLIVYFAADYQRGIREANNPKIVEEISSYKYNGFDFSKDGGIWSTQIEKGGLLYIIMTQYSPLEVENVSVSYNANYFPVLTAPGKEVYLSFDPTEENKSDITVAGVDFAKGLSIVFQVKVIPTCTINGTGCNEIQTCNSTKKGVIELIRDDNPRAEYEGNCLKVYGKDQELIKVVNRILFEWYGILKVDDAGQVYRI